MWSFRLNLVMDIARVLEGGLTGATTLSLIQETLHKIDPGGPRPLLHKSGTLKKIQKHAGDKTKHSSKLFIQLAGELLPSAGYFGITGLGKKKNAVARGALLGALAGLGTAFLGEDENKDDTSAATKSNGALFSHHQKEALKKIETTLLFTAGGMLAGMAVKKIKKGKLKKIKKKLK